MNYAGIISASLSTILNSEKPLQSKYVVTVHDFSEIFYSSISFAVTVMVFQSS